MENPTLKSTLEPLLVWVFPLLVHNTESLWNKTKWKYRPWIKPQIEQNIVRHKRLQYPRMEVQREILWSKSLRRFHLSLYCTLVLSICPQDQGKIYWTCSLGQFSVVGYHGRNESGCIYSIHIQCAPDWSTWAFLVDTCRATSTPASILNKQYAIRNQLSSHAVRCTKVAK